MSIVLYNKMRDNLTSVEVFFASECMVSLPYRR